MAVIFRREIILLIVISYKRINLIKAKEKARHSVLIKFDFVSYFSLTNSKAVTTAENNAATNKRVAKAIRAG